MPWPDLRKWVFIYVLNRLKLLANVDPDKIEVSLWSTSTLRLQDVELDVSRLSSPGVEVEAATVRSITIEMSTSGVKIAGSDVQIEINLQTASPELAFSRILDRTASDLEQSVADLLDGQVQAEIPSEVGYGMGDLSSVVSKVANRALAQLTVDVKDVSVKVQLAGDPVLQVQIGSLRLPKPGLFEIRRLKVERCENLYESMAQSMYFDAGSELSAPITSVASVDTIDIEFDSPLRNIRAFTPSMQIDVLSVLSVIVECLNNSPPSGGQIEESMKPHFEVTVGRLEMQGSARATPITLIDLRLSPAKLIIDSIDAVEVSSSSPVLSVNFDPISVTMQNPIGINLSLDSLSSIANFAQQLAESLLSIETPPPPEPTTFAIDLPEIQLRVGELTLQMFPKAFTQEGLQLEELTLTGEDGTRVVVSNFDLKFDKLDLHVEDLRARIGPRLSQSVKAISDLFVTDSAAPTTPLRCSMNIKHANITSPDWSFSLPKGLVFSLGKESVLSAITQVQVGQSEIVASIQATRFSSRKWALKVTEISGDWFVQSPRDAKNSKSSAAIALPFTMAYQAVFQGELNVHSTSVVLIRFALDGSGTMGAARLVGKGSADLVDSLNLAQIPVATLDPTEVSVKFSPLKIDVNSSKITLRLCADSLAEMTTWLNSFSPPHTDATHKTETEPVDTFDDVDHEAFKYRPLPSTQLPAEKVLDEDLSVLTASVRDNELTDHNISITDEYWPAKSPKASRAPHYYSRLRIARISIQLYDGFDLSATRKELSAAVHRVEQEAAALQDSDLEESMVGDFMYNSIYIGARPGTNDIHSAVDAELGTKGLSRGKRPKVSLVISNLSYKSSLPDLVGGVMLSRSQITVEDFVIKDQVPSSLWDSILEVNSRRDRESDAPAISLIFDEVALDSPEQRWKVQIQPLNLTLDQDTLDFLTRYFQFEPGAESAAPLDPSPSSPTFIQRFEIHDIPLTMSYKPKKVDYAGLRSGHTLEFMNLFVIDRAECVLRHVVVYGASGFDRLGQQLCAIWAPDVASTQLTDLLGGIGVLRSLFKVGSGLRSLMVLPVRNYRKDGLALTGMHRGATKFAKQTSKQVRRKMQKWLEPPKAK